MSRGLVDLEFLLVGLGWLSETKNLLLGTTLMLFLESTFILAVEVICCFAVDQRSKAFVLS